MENATMLATSTAVCHAGAIAAGESGATSCVGSGDSMSVVSTKPLEGMVDERRQNGKGDKASAKVRNQSKPKGTMTRRMN